MTIHLHNLLFHAFHGIYEQEKIVGNDFEVNVKAELEIELLHQKIDMMKEKELYALTKAVEALSEKLDAYRR